MLKRISAVLLAALMALAIIPAGAAANNGISAVTLRQTMTREEGFATVTLTAGDLWSDGSGYQLLLDADANAYGSIIPESGGLTSSGDASPETYAEFEYKIPENADGSLTTTNIVCGDSITITIPAGTYDWCVTNPTPGSRVWIASKHGSVGGRCDDFTFEAGRTYEFVVAKSIHSQYGEDSVDLYVDGEILDLFPHPIPDGAITGYYFENSYEYDHIFLADLDGDGYNWGLNNSAYEGDLCVISESWASYTGGLNPDNLLIFDFITVPSSGMTVTFYVCGSESYPDTYAAYVLTPEDWNNRDYTNMTCVLAASQTTGEWTQRTADLSAFAGQQIMFVIRHFESEGQYYVKVDQVEFWEVPGEEPPSYPTLTIEYVYENGATAAPTYTCAMEPGERYSVFSPEIPGYTPSMEVVAGKMGTSDVFVTVVYTADGPTGLTGDVDCDGDIDFDDVTLLNAYLLNAAELTEQGLINANANGDNKVSSADVVALNKLILGS